MKERRHQAPRAAAYVKSIMREAYRVGFEFTDKDPPLVMRAVTEAL